MNVKHPVGTVVMVALFILGFFGARELISDLSEQWYGDPNDVIACTADAMLCSDGTAVGRTGPNCEFSPCPSLQAPEPEPSSFSPPIPSASSSVLCDPDQRPEVCIKEYIPVCGLVQVACVTSPCEQISETFGNACTACREDSVISYRDGICEV